MTKYNIISILFLFFSTISFSQSDSIFSNVEKIMFPSIIDEITFANLKNYKEVRLEEIESFISSEDKEFQIEISNSEKNKFFILGKFFIDQKIGVLLCIDTTNKVENRSVLYLMMYVEKTVKLTT